MTSTEIHTTNTARMRRAIQALPGDITINVGYYERLASAVGGALFYRGMTGHSHTYQALGAAVAKLFGEEPNQQVEGDLRHFKQIMEAGEIPTTEGQPSGPRSALGAMPKPEHKPAQPNVTTRERYEWMNEGAKSRVQEASEESFPASDPPGWASSKAGGLEEKEAGA